MQGDAASAAKTESDARRSYWTEMMEAADAFMREITAYPLQECHEPMTSLVDAARSAGVDVAFSDLPHVDGLPRRYLLRAGLVRPFLAAAAEMNARGWILKLEDGYRTAQMQRGLGTQERIFASVLRMVQWECGTASPPVDVLFRRLGALVANSPKVGTHMSGSAMDISVLLGDSGKEVDRGGPYLELSERTPMTSPFVSAPAQQNRREITALMGRHGFVTYPWEFWHYNAGDAYAEHLDHTGRPARYGPVHLDASDGSMTPIAEPTSPLNSPTSIRELMERRLAADRPGGRI